MLCLKNVNTQLTPYIHAVAIKVWENSFSTACLQTIFNPGSIRCYSYKINYSDGLLQLLLGVHFGDSEWYTMQFYSWVICFIISLLMHAYHHIFAGQATLTVSSAGPICPQVMMNFTCRTTSSYLRWTANHGSEMIEQITFAAGSSSAASRECRILGSRYILRATIVSHSPDLISNLTLIAFPELNGLRVECNSESTGREVGVLHLACKLFDIRIHGAMVSFIIILMNAAPPSHPDNLHITGIDKDLFYATINLQWNPPSNHSISIINYVIFIHFSSSDMWKTTTESTAVVLKVPYNINFTISVAAVNCAGSGVPAQLKTLSIGKSIHR